MDWNLLGETISRETSDSTEYYGFWMPRGGDEGTFAVEVVNLQGGGFEAQIETKNSEDADSSASVLGSAQALSSAGVSKWTVTGAKEWVRYVIRPQSTGPAGSMHFQFVSPQWTPN